MQEADIPLPTESDDLVLIKEDDVLIVRTAPIQPAPDRETVILEDGSFLVDMKLDPR